MEKNTQQVTEQSFSPRGISQETVKRGGWIGLALIFAIILLIIFAGLIGFFLFGSTKTQLANTATLKTNTGLTLEIPKDWSGSFYKNTNNSLWLELSDWRFLEIRKGINFNPAANYVQIEIFTLDREFPPNKYLEIQNIQDVNIDNVIFKKTVGRENFSAKGRDFQQFSWQYNSKNYLLNAYSLNITEYENQIQDILKSITKNLTREDKSSKQSLQKITSVFKTSEKEEKTQAQLQDRTSADVVKIKRYSDGAEFFHYPHESVPVSLPFSDFAFLVVKMKGIDDPTIIKPGIVVYLERGTVAEFQVKAFFPEDSLANLVKTNTSLFENGAIWVEPEAKQFSKTSQIVLHIPLSIEQGPSGPFIKAYSGARIFTE